MARMLGEKADEEYLQKKYDKAWNSFEKLWREDVNKKGEKLEYYVTCFDPESGNTNTDVWTNQLDALWYLTAIGEPPAIPEERVKKILKAVYDTNRSFMGWPCVKPKMESQLNLNRGRMCIPLRIMFSPSCWIITVWSKKAKRFTNIWIA